MKSFAKWWLVSRSYTRYGERLLITRGGKLYFYRMASQSAAEVESHLCRVAVAQMTSVSDKEKNLSICETLVKKAAGAGAQVIFLPEACDYIAETKEDSINMAESIHGPVVTRYCSLASSLGVWLSLGGLHIKEENEDKVSNTHVLIDSQGKIKSTYKKTHLFSVHIPEKNLRLEESTYITRGEAIHPPVSTPVGKVALAICYDMRFAELSLIQRRLGAQILTFPSAFTVTTGIAHWETILRGRAIESQCYVIAAAQSGQHNKKRSSYGHSLIVDPWGKILCEIPEETDIAVADIDLSYLKKIRKDMPVMSHRRPDLYYLYEMPHSEGLRLCSYMPMPTSYVSYQFGSVSVPGSCIFLKSLHSQAFVNKKPVSPGHVLVTPERPAKRFTDLSPAEICDLIQLTQAALEVIVRQHKPETIQVALQDGPAAGQTIEHVHFHVVPVSTALREKLQGHEMTARWRDTKEMEMEADELRQVVVNNSSLLCAKPVVFEPFEVCEPTFQKESSCSKLDIPDNVLIGKSKHSCAFVAPQPILHGHVCVATLHPGTTLREASADILTDLFLLVQLVQKNMESILNTTSSTIVVLQNLHEMNQELQVHIIPRKEGDFKENDDIYGAVKNISLQSSKWLDSEQSIVFAEQLRNALYS